MPKAVPLPPPGGGAGRGPWPWIGAVLAIVVLTVIIAAASSGGSGSGSDAGGGTPTPAGSDDTSSPEGPFGQGDVDASESENAAVQGTDESSADAEEAPARAITRHFERLGDGEYQRAYGLMSARYHRSNPHWPEQREEADPIVRDVEASTTSIDGRRATVRVSFVAKDQNLIDGSDVYCHRFSGEVQLVWEDHGWHYDPRAGALSADRISRGQAVCQ